MAETNDSAAGSGTRTATPAAAAGPLLVSDIVSVTLELTAGAVVFAVALSERSATAGVSTDVAWSSSAGLSLPGVESGSAGEDALTWPRRSRWLSP